MATEPNPALRTDGTPLSNRLTDDGIPFLTLTPAHLEARDQVVQKLANGSYPAHAIPCPVCAGTAFTRFCDKDRYGLPLTSCICQNCGMVMFNPMVDFDAYIDFYRHHYRQMYGGEKYASEGFFQRQKRQAAKATKFLDGTLMPLKSFAGKVVLDVGCGAGGMTEFFRENGCEAYGADYGEDYLKFGRERGLPLFVGGVTDAKLPRPADLITYIDVFEHVGDLNGELERVREVLAEDGHVLMHMPGAVNIHNHTADLLGYLHIAHAYNFTLKVLTRLMARHGFELVHGNEKVYALYRKLPNAGATMQHNDYSRVHGYMKALETSHFLPKPLRWVALALHRAIRG